MKELVVLGSTGSIGSQCLEIIEKNPDKFKAIVLSCEKRVDDLILQIRKFSPEAIVISKEKDGEKIQKEFPNLEILVGEEGLVKAASKKCHMVINSLVGIRGLVPTWAAIKAGNHIGLANKETLVAGGELIMNEAKKKNVKILPIDSEHSAIFQCLNGEDINKVRKIILTASGGPFRGKDLKFLKGVKLEEALKHPKWKMGAKITIDSATLMNKGLEVIEAKWLFNMPIEKISVIVHPQSIVHSMVEFVDGAVVAQLGNPDMKMPISYAMEYPNRLEIKEDSLSLVEEGNLTFEKPDYETFSALRMAYFAVKEGGNYPIILNGANEALVDLFLQKKIGFLTIQETLEKLMEEKHSVKPKTVEEIVGIDKEIKERIYKNFSKVN